MDFHNLRHNVFSQCGEDGILEWLFQKLKIVDGTLVEFGAWDGFAFSNTQNLWQNNKELRAIFIEPDGEKFRLLQEKNAHPNITCIQAAVTFEVGCLDRLLEGKIHGELLLMSMDTDTDDFAIWRSNALRPKIVIIETGYDADARKELVSRFKQDGYSLLYFTGNWIFVRNDVFQELGIIEQSPDQLYVESTHIGILMSRGEITPMEYDTWVKARCQGPRSEGHDGRNWMTLEELSKLKRDRDYV